ncbi:hypothetical protein Ancab_030962, partial [Ancistrocladus abbreviatus]
RGCSGMHPTILQEQKASVLLLIRDQSRAFRFGGAKRGSKFYASRASSTLKRGRRGEEEGVTGVEKRRWGDDRGGDARWAREGWVFV